MTADAEIDVSAGLSVAIGNLAAQLERQRRDAAQRAAECWYVEAPAIVLPILDPTGAAGPVAYAPGGWGPNTGYCWAVQRVTFYSPVDESDHVTVYRGHTPADAAPQNALNTIAQPSGYLSSATWHPGRVGLVLMPDESLVFSGSVATAGAVVSVDVIQVTSANLPALLL